MRTLKIYCANCKSTGLIYHPQKMKCPFCEGWGYKDIEYNEEAQSRANVKEKNG